MAGSQTLLAFRSSNGSMVVNTYNISSYSSIVESRLSFDVLDKRAEFSNGTMKIFATIALPENMTTLNQVWQVGPSTTNGRPARHEFNPENLNATGSLELVQAGDKNSSSSAPAPTPSGSGGRNNTGGGGGQSGNDTGGCGKAVLNRGIYGCFLLLAGSLVLGY